MAEHNKLLSLKLKDEVKIMPLEKEISSMKNTKISLLRKMHEDNNKFAEWNSQHENDMKRPKIQEKKKDHKISEM